MENKTALITGATSGIGAAFARYFAKEKYDLIITGRRKDILMNSADELTRLHHVPVQVVIGDLATDDGLRDLLSVIQNKPIDVLVNNAGYGLYQLFQDAPLEQVDSLIKLQVNTPVHLIHAILPGMIHRHSGTIINVSSESVYLSISKNSIYSGAKSFLKSFSECLHLDLINTGVRVMAVCPGLTHSDFHEKMGMQKSQQKNNGFIKWMEADEVVEICMNDHKKEKVISIPGFHTQLEVFLLNLLPKKLYYSFILKAFN